MFAEALGAVMKIRTTNSFLVSSLLVSALASLVAHAQVSEQAASVASSAQSSITKFKKEAEVKKDFSLDLGIEYSQKTAVEEKGSTESSTDFLIAPNYKINNKLSLAAKAVVSKENSNQRQTSISDTKIALALKGFKLSEQFETLHSISGVVPTNEDSQKQDRLYTSIGLTNGIKFSNAVAEIKYKLGLSRNFHEFNINADGSPNIEYRLANTLEIKIPVTESFSITSVGTYRLGRTYAGAQRTDFIFDTDLNYDILENLSVNLGTSNEGGALKANGVDSNISAFNENTSVYRLGLSLTL